jgi:hypothetical protein
MVPHSAGPAAFRTEDEKLKQNTPMTDESIYDLIDRLIAIGWKQLPDSG